MFVARACCALFIFAVLVACGSVPAAQAPSPAPTVAPAASAADTSTAPAASAPASPAASAAESGAAYPLTIENCGRTLTFDRAPERILVSYQSTAELLVALGLTDKIVGVQYGKAQEPLPELAAEMNTLPFLVEPGLGSAAKETLIATRPDFVLVTYFSYDLDASTGAASEADYQAVGAQVYGMAADAPCLTGDQQLGLETIYADIRTLGAIFGVPERAAALIEEMQGRITAVHERVASREPLKAVYYEDGTGPFTVYGAGLSTELLALAGGRNVLADQPAYTQVGQEVLADSGAEVWVITEYPGFEPVEQRARFLYETFPNLPASHDKRSVGINGAEAGVGIRLPGVIETLARAFHPEAFAGSSAVGASYPVTIENCGVTTTYDKPPERVVSTALNVTELLLALELQDSIAGAISPGDRLPAPYRERFAGVNVIAEQAFPPPSREVIVAADPDLILSGYADDYGEAGFGTRQSFQDQGINTWLPRGACGDTPATIDDTYADIELLGRMFGVPDRAAALVAQMQAEQATAEPPATPVRVFNFDSGEEAPFTTGRNGLLTDLIARAGGENIFADVEQSYFTAGWEDVLARDPEVIVVTSSGATPDAAQIDAATQAKIDFLRANPQLATVAAIRNNRLVVLDITSQVPSVRNAAAIVTLARAFTEPGPSGVRR